MLPFATTSTCGASEAFGGVGAGLGVALGFGVGLGVGLGLRVGAGEGVAVGRALGIAGIQQGVALAPGDGFVLAPLQATKPSAQANAHVQPKR